jgi:hypothetical protein
MFEPHPDDRAKLLAARASVLGFAEMFKALIAKANEPAGREMLVTMLAEADQTIAAIDDRIAHKRPRADEFDR